MGPLCTGLQFDDGRCGLSELRVVAQEALRIATLLEAFLQILMNSRWDRAIPKGPRNHSYGLKGSIRSFCG